MVQSLQRTGSVIIREAIEVAGSEQEILVLLASHIEAVRQFDEQNLLPWAMRHLPLAGTDDIKSRIQALHLIMRRARSHTDDRTVSVIEEALSTFQTALRRAAQLQCDDGPSRLA